MISDAKGHRSLKSKGFRWFLLAVVSAVCLLPSLLNLAGFDFGHGCLKGDELQGLLIHTIMVWTATCMAFFAFVLSFYHYVLNHDVVMPVIGIGLLWGGFMDLFQTLAADRFITSQADVAVLIPFMWAIGRVFGIIILLIGIMILMIRRYQGGAGSNTRFFVLLAIAFGLIALGVGDYLSRADLPQVVFPEMLISRPWDMLPLFIYGLAGLWIFRRFYQDRRDHFSFAVWISILPDFVAQMHMAFGSIELFDNHYTLAHFFKVVSYAVPATGILKDSLDTHRSLQKQSRERERVQREKTALSRLVDQGTEMVASLDQQGNIVYMNHVLRQNLGWQRELGFHFSQILQSPNGKDIWIGLQKKSRRYGYVQGELELVTQDRSRLIPVHFSLFPLETVQNDDSDLGFGIQFHDITEMKHQQAERERHEKELQLLIQKRTDELAQVNRKIREELRERRLLEEKLVQAQKMDAMGQLSAGIAHEINNPVGFVGVNLETLGCYWNKLLGALDLYKELAAEIVNQYPEQVQLIQDYSRKNRLDFLREDAPAMLAESKEGLARITDIVKSLRAFAHPDTNETEVVDVQQVMEISLKMVWNEVKQHRLIRQFKSVRPVVVSPVLLSQVLVNLLLNATQAMESPGELTLRIREHETYVVIEVKDTGSGIRDEYKGRLFDPFFTTKPVGSGTGLGLYITYTIVQKYRGELTFWSEREIGTTFQIRLPVANISSV